MCVFCKQSEKYLCNVDGGKHMCCALHARGGGVRLRQRGSAEDKEILPRQMESFWPNEMRTRRRVEGLLGLGNGYDNS